MDLREKKTRRSIASAFLALRAKKPLERITVKELAELAEISKATFYLHYKDIYDLSEQLQNEVIQKILAGLSQPELYLSDPPAFTRQLFYAFSAEQPLIQTLFSGSQSLALPARIERELLDFIKKQQPDMDRQAQMRLTYTVYGSYCVYQKYYREYPLEEIIAMVCEAANTGRAT